MTGILIELIGGCAIILILVFLFPILKKFNEALALGYAGFRFLEVGFLFIGSVLIFFDIFIGVSEMLSNERIL